MSETENGQTAVTEILTWGLLAAAAAILLYILVVTLLHYRNKP